MPEQRIFPPPARADRRSFPRPPLWLNLLLLLIAATTFVFAAQQRSRIREKSAVLFQNIENSPAELNRVRDELAQMDLNRDQLASELDGRLKYLESVQGEQFYISIDTAKKRMQFRIGKDVVREAPVEIGPARTIASRDGRTWTFLPLKGAFNVIGTDSDYTSAVPSWVYAMRNEPIRGQEMRNWLGRYVIFLPNHYVIHSPPPPDSPLQGPKPGSLMVPEADLAAIWPRISKDTRVYIF